MMTKEEYRKQLVRMWDSLRKNECKGQITCLGVRCEDCPLINLEVCQCSSHSVDVLNVYKAIEAVENWAKQHPIVTNADKFREVFGFKPYTKNCINGEVKCDKCECYDYGVCNASRFWEDEYMPPKEGEE